jgi:serine/threonine protein kinase
LSESISPNTTIAHYTIVSKIGAGGRREVYRARDTRLDREVAIKILPSNCIRVDLLPRFEQKANVTSALNQTITFFLTTRVGLNLEFGLGDDIWVCLN